MIVREATLDDVSAIVEVYLTVPDRPFARPIDGMSIAERNSYGGPWMCVESCAIHMNNMLAWGYVPLVVEEEGRVIAETEYYVGRDVPPLGKTLDISVLYVKAEHQRKGAGTLLMEEMISRAKDAGCDNITLSGGSPSQGFYDRFGFRQLLDLCTINCPVAGHGPPLEHAGYSPSGFEPAPSGTMWIGRFLSPAQKWREVHDRIKRREPILPEHAGRPKPVGIGSESREAGELVAFVIPEWGDARKADAYCWSESVTQESVTQILSLAANAGCKQLCLLCHPETAGTVARAFGSEPKGSLSIQGKKL